MNSRRILSGTLLLIAAAFLTRGEAAELTTETPVGKSENWLLTGPREELFRKGGNEASLSLGYGFGMPVFGSQLRRSFALGMAEYGWMLTDVLGKEHWYRGNVEVMADIFGGFQYHPGHAYLVGAGPEFRYNFVTGTRIVPFFTAGAGLSATDIRGGELSTTFEFNLHAGPGVRLMIEDNLAVTVQYRFIHMSNAGMDLPNLGINNSVFLVGASLFF